MIKLTVSGVLSIGLIAFSMSSFACDNAVRDRAKMMIGNAVALQDMKQDASLYNMHTGDCEPLGLVANQDDVGAFIPQDEVSQGAYNFYRLDGADSLTALKRVYKVD